MTEIRRFTCRFAAILRTAGVKTVRLPARRPNPNAYAERFVLSARRECLDKVIPLGEQHFRKIVSDFLQHYHGERNHQGLENRLIVPLVGARSREGTVKCRERLGGVLNYYYRDADAPRRPVSD